MCVRVCVRATLRSSEIINEQSRSSRRACACAYAEEETVGQFDYDYYSSPGWGQVAAALGEEESGGLRANLTCSPGALEILRTAFEQVRAALELHMKRADDEEEEEEEEEEVVDQLISRLTLRRLISLAAVPKVDDVFIRFFYSAGAG